MQRRFPNLFVVGAMKAGTSSLHEYLHQHPQIFMSRFKEPHYFAPHATRWGQMWGQGNPFPEEGIDWYLRLFTEADGAAYAGESSVSYTARPWVGDCERRIYEFNPEARIIYLMRDPVERAVSHYWHFVNDGREDRDMLTAMRRKEEYVARSDYAMQIAPYIELFGAERVLLLTLEELNAEPLAVFRRIFTWLGVDPDVQVSADTRHNVGKESLRQTRRGLVPADTLLKHWRVQPLRRRMPRLALAGIERLVYRAVDRKRVDSQPAIDYLRPILERRTRALASMMGRELPEWTTLYGAHSGRLACTGA